MSKFRIGDKVRVIEPTFKTYGVEGVVTKINEENVYIYSELSKGSYKDSELELLERKNFKKGDRVLQKTYGKGTVISVDVSGTCLVKLDKDSKYLTRRDGRQNIGWFFSSSLTFLEESPVNPYNGFSIGETVLVTVGDTTKKAQIIDMRLETCDVMFENNSEFRKVSYNDVRPLTEAEKVVLEDVDANEPNSKFKVGDKVKIIDPTFILFGAKGFVQEIKNETIRVMLKSGYLAYCKEWQLSLDTEPVPCSERTTPPSLINLDGLLLVNVGDRYYLCNTEGHCFKEFKEVK